MQGVGVIHTEFYICSLDKLIFNGDILTNKPPYIKFNSSGDNLIKFTSKDGNLSTENFSIDEDNIAILSDMRSDSFRLQCYNQNGDVIPNWGLGRILSGCKYNLYNDNGIVNFKTIDSKYVTDILFFPVTYYNNQCISSNNLDTLMNNNTYFTDLSECKRGIKYKYCTGGKHCSSDCVSPCLDPSKACTINNGMFSCNDVKIVEKEVIINTNSYDYVIPLVIILFLLLLILCICIIFGYYIYDKK